jgi:hypothetical protein
VKFIGTAWALAIGLSLAACRGGKEEETPESVLAGVADALAAGDAARFKNLLSESSRRLYEALPEPAKKLEAAERVRYAVVSREIVGDTATLTLDSGDRRRFVREEGRWKLDLSASLRSAGRLPAASPAPNAPPPPGKG